MRNSGQCHTGHFHTGHFHTAGRFHTGNRLLRALMIAVLAFIPAGCSSLGLSSVTGLFKPKKIPLKGERVAVLKPQSSLKVNSTIARRPLRLPQMVQNASWSQPGGTASNAPGHLAFKGSLQTIWRKSAGDGSGSRSRLTASPIVYQGRIYTLDTSGDVRALTTSQGKLVWRVDLTPATEKDYEGFGGGLAIDSGVLVAATGYGTVHGLDLNTGKKLWSKTIGVPIKTSITAQNGKVFLLTTEGRLYCLSTATGDELWSARGVPEAASMLSNISPAIYGNKVVVPYTSGEITALDVKTGKPLWSESLVRTRGRSVVNALNYPARPVVANGMVVALGLSGRMIATRLKTGEREWQQTIAGAQMPWVAGDAVFVVDLEGRLIALDRRKGLVRWMVDLPKAKAWNGPVLAGGRLWLVSSKGLVIGVNPHDGQVQAKRALGEKVYIAPVIADGRMFIYTDSAKLIALN